MKSTELMKKLKSVSASSGLKHTSTVYYKGEKKLVLKFTSPIVVDGSAINKMQEVVASELNTSLEIVVEVEKFVTQSEFVCKSVYDFLSYEHAIVCKCMEPSDVTAEISDGIGEVVISLEPSVCSYLNAKNTAEYVAAFLEKKYIEKFRVSIISNGKRETGLDELLVGEKQVEPEPLIIRKLRVEAVTRLFDNDETDEASYICDTRKYVGSVYLAGTITSITEKIYKGKNKKGEEEEKPYFMIEISDRTGSVSGTIFPSKDKLTKLKKLTVDSEIILSGEFQVKDGYKNLRIHSINYCCFPKNFVPVPRPKKPLPKYYRLIEPKPMVILSQQSFFVNDEPPECFKDRTFVVFDFETTGMDMSDKITEVGAVKVVDGKITEYFSSLINPQKKIPSNVVEITGIDDEMVKNAPLFSEVCPDFYKFCYGATLVAHNIEFDSRFLHRQANPLDYVFDNREMDTLAIAREVIPGLPHYKLNNLCERFNIELHHHRAYFDAFATAKLFIELIRIRKDFPE